MIDTNGDAVADLVYRVRVAPAAGGGQTATLRRIEGAKGAVSEEAGTAVFDSVAVSMGRDAHIAAKDDMRFFAGWRSEPFFFDTLGALDDLKFTGSDFFADKNVCSIVLELPNTALGSGPVDLWARILARKDGRWVQVERGARPQQAVFLPGDAKGDYLAGEPVDDARFVPVFAHALEHAGGYTPQKATDVAKTLLPDMLRFDPPRPAAFPVNGRSLTDDAADVFMAILTNGKIPGDGVGHHHDLLDEFPYVGPPHA